MSKSCTNFKPKFDDHNLCHICRTYRRQNTCHVCSIWSNTAHIKSLEKKLRAAKIRKFRAFLAFSTPQMSSDLSAIDSGQSTTSSRSTSIKSSQVPKKVVWSDKGVKKPSWLHFSGYKWVQKQVVPVQYWRAEWGEARARTESTTLGKESPGTGFTLLWREKTATKPKLET